MSEYRTLLHLTSGSDELQDRVLLSLNNLQADIGDVVIEVVAQAGGVCLFVRRPPALDLLAKSGVRFVACAHSLAGRQIDASQLPVYVDVVPSAVGELVRRQAEGWSYLFGLPDEGVPS